MSKKSPKDFGLVNLAQKEGSLLKKALLCRTGSFEGMNGPVVVTTEMLETLAENYKLIRANPTNENDFAPILLDHNRQVDLVKGRLLAEGMEVAEWKEINGKMEWGLFGTLRVDDPEAKANVESGKYAHLSISFDEDSGEIFEVSFVAVEAARGSIVLSQGEKNMGLEKKLSRISQRHQALAQSVKQARTKRQTALSALQAKGVELSKELGALMTSANQIALSVKAGQLKGQFAGFVRGGKMSPAELAAINFTEMATLSEGAMKIVLSSYESRPVSTDVFQFGQSSDNKVTVDLSPGKMREAIKLQREGKKTIKLAGEEPAPMVEDKDHDGMSAGMAPEEIKSYAMGEEEWMKCMEDISAVHTKLSEVVDKIKAMGGDVESLAADEKSEEEKELAAEEEDKKLAAEDEEDKKDKEEKGE